MRAAEKLSATKVSKLKKPGRYGDGRGLWLHIRSTGTKAWVLRYMLHGKPREMGLGPLDAVGLADARERARTARRQIVAEGIDPIDARKATQAERRVAVARNLTFKAAAESYMATHEAGWKNEKHRDQWRSTLGSYAYPIIGNLPVAAIDTGLVLKVLKPIWNKTPETASRLRGRIESILDSAAAAGARSGENPARWKGHLEKLLTAKADIRAVKHHPALPYADLPAFMPTLRAAQGISARALEFTILTAARTSEIIKARWEEIDTAEKVWTVPAERMKGKKGKKREHRVPLSSAAFDLLQQIPREGEFIFPGRSARKPLSNMAMLELMRDICPGYVPHGFRSSFRDWAFEQTNFSAEIVEAALAHVNKNKVEAAYKRGDALEKRRRLMRDWARHCGSAPQVQAATVTPIGRGRA